MRVVDLRWLQPLNADAIARHAGECDRILVVDEGRRSAGVGEGIITAVVEAGQGAKPLRRVVGEDTYTPLAGAAFLVIPSDDDIVAMAERLANMPTKALVATRALLQSATTRSLSEHLDAERDTQSALGRTHDYFEGVQAFLEKRPAQFKGE